MKVLYIDCPNGVSGDMLLGAFLSAGLPESRLREKLATLDMAGWGLTAAKRNVSGLECVDVSVSSDEHHPHRGLSQVQGIIADSGLEQCEKDLALAVFLRLAIAEAKVHGTTVEQIHFHEVGAVDAIVDICGAAIGFCWAAAGRVVCSPLPLGSGFVDCMHGTIPVPAPATVELLAGVPVYSNGMKGELVTPTGAAIVSAAAAEFGEIPPMRILAVGYGCGKREFAVPNAVRLLLGEATDSRRGVSVMDGDRVAVVECNIDDDTPEVLANAAEFILSSGALDVWMSPVVMKKGRPGVTLSVLCGEGDVDKVARALMEHTSTFGVRTRTERRVKLRRELVEVQTPFGTVRMKAGFLGDALLKLTPEYEDCARLAREQAIAVGVVFDAARLAAARGAGGE